MGKNRGMRRSISLLAVASMLLGASIVMAPTASACGAAGYTRSDVFRSLRKGNDPARSGNAMETMTLRTFHVEVVQDKKVYKIGDIAKFDVTVTRPANEDPLGEGNQMPWDDRPYVEPAPGAIVGIGLHIGRVFLPGAALTDENGVAKIRIKIENYAPANTIVDASVYAWKTLKVGPVEAQTQCATIQEDGFKVMPRTARTAP